MDIGRTSGFIDYRNLEDKIISMWQKEDFKDRSVLVVGLARSGYAAVELLLELKAKVAVSEKQIDDNLKKIASELKAKGVEVELGGHSQDILEGKDLVVLSPGVEQRAEMVRWAEERRIPIISEIELGYLVCPAKIIAVSGTNGKTTVTSLIGRCLEEAGKTVHICGNIGVPFSSKIKEISPDDFVALEVSSFQLERIVKFRPYISVMLNFSPDHLDRYQSIEEYLEAKKRLFMNQTIEDFAVLNYDDPYVRKMSQDIKAKVIFFSQQCALNSNFSAVKKIAEILGLEDRKIEKVFSDFKGIEHRLEYVRTIKGVDFINDSKATNPESTLWALDNIHSPIILLAGGRNKGLSFDKVKPKVKEKIKLMVVMGEAKGILKEEFKGLTQIKEADSLPEAVRIAFSNANCRDTVLLSPMCASFDMFRNYEERGKLFKQVVEDLARDYA